MQDLIDHNFKNTEKRAEKMTKPFMVERRLFCKLDLYL